MIYASLSAHVLQAKKVDKDIGSDAPPPKTQTICSSFFEITLLYWVVKLLECFIGHMVTRQDCLIALI